MKKLKRTAIILAALAMCGSLLAGCAVQKKEQPGALPPDFVEATESDDLTEARRVLDVFLDGMVNYDLDRMLESSNLRTMIALANTPDFNEESLRKQFEGNSAEAKEEEQSISYQVNDIRFDTEMLGEFEEYYAKLSEFEQSEDYAAMDEEERAEYDRKRALFPDVKKIVTAEVQVNLNSAEEEPYEYTETYTVYCGADGKWSVDLDVLWEFMSLVPIDSRISANAAAKSLFNAANTALVDMECVSLDIKSLAGEHTYYPADFEEAAMDDQQDLEKKMLHSIYNYYTDIQQLDCVMLSIDKDGVCTAVAVAHKDSYSCYPLDVSDGSESEQEFDSIEAAFEYAKALTAANG